MVIIKLNGGLGNQLFQYAAGKALAKYHGVALKLDTSVFKDNTLRPYELGHFAVTAPLATPDEISFFTFKNCPGCFRFLKKLLQRIKPHYLRTVYKEPHFHFDDNFFKAGMNVCLNGYWQSERYFQNIRFILQKEFQVVHPLEGKNRELSEKIQGSNSVSVHIRRGDYVRNNKTHKFHGVCAIDYYTKAIQQIKDETESPHFYVFSDDTTWAKSNINITGSITFVDHNNANTAYEDFRLMTLCKNHIVANSSFSWWSAWLSDYRDKIVIAPAKWFKTSNLDIKDLIPQGWLKI